MNNLEKLNKVFVSTFNVEDSQVSELSYGNFNLWDSVGQMSLIANIEDAFDIMVEPEDIMDINSFLSAKDILSEKYSIKF